MTGLVVGMVVLAIVCGYIATSIFLLKFPTLLHKKKHLKFKPKHISHRGGAGECLENTMSAFKHAFDQGTEMFEIDCHITKDGEVVVSHDNCLERECGCDVNITETDYKDLPQLSSSLSLDFYPGFRVKGDDRKIPLLRDLFAAYPDMPINIDIKIDNDDLIDRVNALIIEFKREDITVWGHRSGAVSRKIYKKNPDIPLFFPMRRVVMLVLLFYSGLLPFVPLKESLFEIFMPSLALDFSQKTMNFSRKTRILLRIMDMLLIRPALFQHLEKRGIQTYFWVLNEEHQFERAFKLGIAGVMTDFPTKLNSFLQKHHSSVKNHIS